MLNQDESDKTELSKQAVPLLKKSKNIGWNDRIAKKIFYPCFERTY